MHMKEFTLRSTSFGALFSWWRIRGRACIGCFVAVGAIKTTGSRRLQERHVVKRIEQALEVVRNLQ